MESPSADVRVYRNEDGSGLFFGDYCNWARVPEYRAFVFDSPAARIAARLTRSRTIRLFHEHVLVKEPGTEVATPWHQDQPYYCVDGEQTCSLWTTLDPVAQEVCPEFVAGSHRWGKFYRPERFNRQPLNEADGLEAVPDIDGHRADYDIRSWAMEPGDTIAFSFRTVHGAPPNRSSQRRRRAFSSRWTGDDCRFAARSGVTSPPFRDVRLRHGDPLVADEFPLVIGGSPESVPYRTVG
jgi:ectoine hydroxylase-related dioxygenase (phytanoyl-CoA dioxygenase family)